MKKLRFSGRLIKVYTWQNKDFVQHPGAAVIVPFVSKDKVIMVRQPRFAINQMTWEVPAGTLGKGENPFICAKRELEEETGLKAGKIKKILSFYSGCMASGNRGSENSGAGGQDLQPCQDDSGLF